MKRFKIILILSVLILIGAAKSYSQVGIDVSITANVAPPPLVVYEQPPCPYDGYLWVPGYWAYDYEVGYYWVPGEWVRPPMVGYLWTPCYWEYTGGIYRWHPGYWGSHVGFYGGVSYGYGYWGVGFVGGSWQGSHFRYNTAVVNVNTTVVHNTYVDRSVVVNNRVSNRASFNGIGGVVARPSEREQVVMRENHVRETSVQMAQQRDASRNRNQYVSVNRGHPSTPVMNATRPNPSYNSNQPATRGSASHLNNNVVVPNHTTNRFPNSHPEINQPERRAPIHEQQQMRIPRETPQSLPRRQMNMPRDYQREMQQHVQQQRIQQQQMHQMQQQQMQRQSHFQPMQQRQMHTQPQAQQPNRERHR